MIQVALYNRPDLLAAEANFRSKAESLKAAERQWLPQVNYSFNLGKNVSQSWPARQIQLCQSIYGIDAAIPRLLLSQCHQDRQSELKTCCRRADEADGIGDDQTSDGISLQRACLLRHFAVCDCLFSGCRRRIQSSPSINISKV